MWQLNNGPQWHLPEVRNVRKHNGVLVMLVADPGTAVDEKETMLIPFAVWSSAFAKAGAPPPKLADLIAAVQEAAKRVENAAVTEARFYSGGVLNEFEMRQVVCLCNAAELLARVRDNVQEWPDRVKDVIRGKPKYEGPRKRAS